MARTYKPWDKNDAYFETNPSENVRKCAHIITNYALNEDKKIELLKDILPADPAYVHERFVFWNTSEPGNKNNGTLLNLAVCTEHRGIAQLLLQYGADPDARDRFGHAPVAFICEAMVYKNCSEFVSFEFFKLLLSYGANLKSGCYFAGVLRNSSSNRVIRLLMEYGAEDAKEHLKWSLNCCPRRENIFILIKCLLARNPDRRKPSFLLEYKSVSEYWDNCKVEASVERDLINERLLKDTTISVHDIYFANERTLADYVRNDAIEQLATKYTHLYPLYGPMIERQYRRGRRRMILENQGQIVMKHWHPSLCNFSVCQKFLQYLALHDMRNLREAGILVLNSNA